MDKIIKRKEYLKQWWKNNKTKRREYEKRYKLKHPNKIKKKEDRRRKRQSRIEYTKRYKKSYIKRPEVLKKHKIRCRSNKKYGKTPFGFHKHHLTYENPDEFIIVPIKTHTSIHSHKNKTMREVKENGNVKRNGTKLSTATDFKHSRFG